MRNPDMKKQASLNVALPIALGTLLMVGASGCDLESGEFIPRETATAEGAVTETLGTQHKSFGGEGTLDHATHVRTYTLGESGDLFVFGEAEIDANGRYAVDVPAHTEHIVLQAVDADSRVVASAVLEESGGAGEKSTVTPMDTETSVEAEVLIEMLQEGWSNDEANYADLRGRIDSEIAADVRVSAMNDADEGQARIRALARAIIAAQKAETRAYGDRGWATTQAELFDTEKSASMKLSADLDSDIDADVAYKSFFSGIRSVDANVTAPDRAHFESQSSAAFRAVIDADSGADDHFAMLCNRSTALVEAQTTAAAMAEVFANAEPDAQARVYDAAATLRGDLFESASDSDIEDAWSVYRAELYGSPEQGSNSVLAAHLGVRASALIPSATEIALETFLATAIDAGNTLDAQVTASANLAAMNDNVNIDLIAETVTTSYASFTSELEAQESVLAEANIDGSTVVNAVVVGEGAYCAEGM